MSVPQKLYKRRHTEKIYKKRVIKILTHLVAKTKMLCAKDRPNKALKSI